MSIRHALAVRTSSAMLVLTVGVAGAGNPKFTDVSAAAGVTVNHQPTYLHGFPAGGTVGDFDGDGLQDIFVPVGGGAPDRLYINQGDGTFQDRAATYGIAVSHRGTGAAAADFDGDGWLDLYVTSLGPANQDQIGHHRLYRNQGGASFVDVAVPMNVNRTSTSGADGWSAAWGDYDLDGDLDLAVAGWAQPATGNRLFRNDGATFTDVTASAGLGALTGVYGFTPRFVDMNGDGDPELIWIGDFTSSKYFTNDGDGTFTNQTGGSGTAHDGTEMGMTIGDYDEDGDFDFYVTTIGTNNLYVNQGNDQYQNQAVPAGVQNTAFGWGTVSIDFDHDGRLDLVATSAGGRPYAFVNQTNIGGPVLFQEIGPAIGLSQTMNGRGLSNLDYDGDGDQDLVFFPHGGPVKLYRNDLSGADIHWLRVFLDPGCRDGVAPHGVGSIVTAKIGLDVRRRWIDGGSNYLSASELSAHFGLGAATQVDELTIEWTNGEITVLTNVAADQTLTITPPNAAVDLGFGKVGGNNRTAALSLCGTLATGDGATLALAWAAPSRPALLFASIAMDATQQTIAGTLVPKIQPGTLILPFLTDADGKFSIAVPGGGGPFAVYTQIAIDDPGATDGFASSNAIRIDFGV